MGNLSLQVGTVDLIVVANGELADACCAEIEAGRRTQATGTDYQDVCIKQILLAFYANLIKQDVAAETK